jgi:hypothetical protein
MQNKGIPQLAKKETLSQLERRLSKKSIPELKAKVNKILNKIPGITVESWDRVN